jgi:hypothetical protein
MVQFPSLVFFESTICMPTTVQFNHSSRQRNRCAGLAAKYNNLLIELINIFADVKERRKEREESWALMQTPSWTRKYMQ